MATNSEVMSMEMKPVESSNISAIGFDAASGTMHVQFTNQKTYEYLGVPAEVFERFEKAESKGRFFAQEVRPKFTGTQYVEQPQTAAPAPADQVADTQATAAETAEHESGTYPEPPQSGDEIAEEAALQRTPADA